MDGRFIFVNNSTGGKRIYLNFVLFCSVVYHSWSLIFASVFFAADYGLRNNGNKTDRSAYQAKIEL